MSVGAVEHGGAREGTALDVQFPVDAPVSAIQALAMFPLLFLFRKLVLFLHF